ncbi:hypothetical protein [Streptomyces sp. Ru71]|uniref:hypothetical protein n=1 Tax=Streptomyces sp. Ru71 TaxID=2080746 RepID=UPI0021563ECA|nr:hypothetical protein [Streptomyces sp. Ru71]
MGEGFVEDLWVLEDADGADLVRLRLRFRRRSRGGALCAELEGSLLGAVLGDFLQGDPGPFQVGFQDGPLGRRGDGYAEGFGASVEKAKASRGEQTGHADVRELPQPKKTAKKQPAKKTATKKTTAKKTPRRKPRSA